MYPRSTAPVLHDISLQVNRGEFLGIIGPTGAGKTTLCLSFNGIVPQFYGGRFFGHTTVAGLDTLEHPISTLARHVGVVFEDPDTQLITTSVENEVAFALENLQVPPEEIRARIRWALAAVRLEGTERKHPHELSGGQKQRLAIAAALAPQPDLLVLDEPTSQLDSVGAQEVFATVRALRDELGVTVVMVSHAAEEMAEYANRIAVLVQGRLVTTGTPDAIYSEIDRLREWGLRPPQVASAFHSIARAGVSISKVPVRLAEGVAALHSVRDRCTVAPSSNLQEPAPSTAGPLLSVRNLRYTYDNGTEALRGVSLDIHQGEYLLIIGQNGAGKSTLVKHFLNLLQPTEGAVAVAGADTRDLAVSDLARRIGYIAQNPDTQIFNVTVYDEVAFAPRHLDQTPEEVETRVIESLEAMRLLEHRSAHPFSLPREARARVVMAAVLAMEPEIIIFDEPTTGQDYLGARTILDFSRRLHRMGKTIIVITHHLYLMPEYAERVVVMGRGTILLDAPLREAYHQTELLRSTFLVPPQAVLLAQELGQMEGGDVRLLTPIELAACFGRASENSTA